MSSNQAGPLPRNPLKARLDARETAVGVLVTMPGVATVQTLARQGFDWLFIDTEHGPIGIESVHSMVAATQGTACAPIVRVPWNEAWLVKRVLDTGAMGIIFPTIRSADEARAAVSAMRYPPTGERGFGPIYAPMRFDTTMIGYVEPADAEITCILLIEHRDAIDDIEAIVAVPGVDACIIAPFDLAMSYGYRDGPDHQEVHDATARAEAAILAAGIPLGGLALEAATANDLIGRGYGLVIAGIDALLLQRAAADVLGAIQR